MADELFAVSPEWSKRAWIDAKKYEEMYARSVKDPEGFWADESPAHRLVQGADQDQERVLRRQGPYPLVL